MQKLKNKTARAKDMVTEALVAATNDVNLVEN